MMLDAYIFYKHDDGAEAETKVMPASDFDRIAADVKLVFSVCRIEQLYHMLVRAVTAFNELAAHESERVRFAADDIVEGELYRISCNQHAANFLTVLQMYQDFLNMKDKSQSLFGIDAVLFQKESFEFCHGLRNYIQHVSCFPLTLTHGGSMLACGESLCSSHVFIPTKELQESYGACFPSTKKTIDSLAGKHETVDVSQMFLDAMDFIGEVHAKVRNSMTGGLEYEKARERLMAIDEEYLGRGMWYYRHEEGGTLLCRGTMPYLAQRQIKIVDYFRRVYRCDRKSAATYVTSMPQTTIERLAWADRDVAGYVHNGGVVAEFDGGDKKITSSKYRDAKIAGRYTNDWIAQNV